MLDKYSFGIGDRFSLQGKAQLEAFKKAEKNGLIITPVWNKSNREHQNIRSEPGDVRIEADSAVMDLGWEHNYFVDADHINIETVDRYLESSDFFTIDITSSISKDPGKEELEIFIRNCRKFTEEFIIPGISKKYFVDRKFLNKIGTKYITAIKEAREVYKIIKKYKKEEYFVTEISIDETENAQTPLELFFILKLISDFNIPVLTIAPKFSGRFNKGVDYIGNIKNFSEEFEENLLVIDYAIKEFGLPHNLKLSIHSGSDKFGIYPEIGRIIKKHNKGIHVKTAGTTWLEEVCGLAASGDEALDMVKKIYLSALDRIDELTGPYSDVISIDYNLLPTKNEINKWTSIQFLNALQHDTEHPEYNLNFRQLIHVSYKIAAEMGDEFYDQLRKNDEIIGKFVTNNIYNRHFKRLFGV
ncbi:tagaturonate epimerase family protein [Bacteroidota bacterium]